MTSRTKLTLCLSLLTLLAMSGCSKCGSTSAPTDAASAKTGVTKAQFIEKADALCRRNDDKLGDEFESMPKPATEEEWLKWSLELVNKSLDSQEALAKEIHTLEQPSEDSALLQQVLQGDAKRRETTRALGKALQSQITKSELDQRNSKLRSDAREISVLAKKYGFTFCFSAETPAQ